jgi:hypothetical protein
LATELYYSSYHPAISNLQTSPPHFFLTYLIVHLGEEPTFSTPKACVIVVFTSHLSLKRPSALLVYYNQEFRIIYSWLTWALASIVVTMASQQNLFSPAELAYLHQSLSLHPPIRPDGRSPTQFRPLTAETGVLPGTNGSARVHFADGTEAIVGVKAEIEKTGGSAEQHDEEDRTRGDWLELAVEIPGQRDDEASTVFLAEMLREALLADNEFAKKLRINKRFHWRLYLDVCGIESS